MASALGECCSARVPVAAIALSSKAEARALAADQSPAAPITEASTPRRLTVSMVKSATAGWSPSGSALYLSTLRLRL